MLSWLFSRRRPPGATLAEAARIGLQHHQSGDIAKAEAVYRSILRADPGHFDATHMLGVLLAERGELDAAVDMLERAVLLRPDWQAARENLAVAHRDRAIRQREQGRLEDAVRSLERALELKRVFPEAELELGHVRTAAGDWRAALAHFQAAAAQKPEYAEARWAYAMAQLPAVYAHGEDPAERREAFARELTALEQWLGKQPPAEAFRAVAVHQPFYLAYQDEPNRELLARYGRLCVDLMAPWQVGAGLAARSRAPHARPRVGIISAHLYRHSVWSALIRGWVERLDARKVELHMFHLSAHHDEETRFAQSRAAAFTAGRRGFEEWAQLMHAAELDVAIYPEIGMDATTAKLAAQRLAPLQAASWGHPETSGLPTIDVYLSAEGLEPADGARHYSERLVKLPELGCWLPRPAAGTGRSAPPAIGGAGPILVCPGSPFKYAPRHDEVLTGIAKRLGECRFVFFTGSPPQLGERLQERLRHAFQRAGLEYERHVKVVAWQTPQAFRRLLEQADLYLDTLGFSGFNTALQAIEGGLPIVACEGRFLRGRLASGILRRIGLDELVAASPEAYVELAVALAKDAPRRAGLRRRIGEARARLYESPAPVSALHAFLLQA